MLAQLLVNGLLSGCLIALSALGFALIFSTTRVFHLAHGAIFTAAAYTLYALHTLGGTPLVLASLASIGVGVLLGLSTEFGVYRPLGRVTASSLAMLLSSLGCYVVITNLISIAFGDEQQIIRASLDRTYTLGSVVVTRVRVAQAAAALIVLPAVLVFLRVAGWGKRIRAARDNPGLCEAMGINLHAVRILVFTVGSALAALAAVLQSLDVGIDPGGGMSIVLVSAAAVIVGGVGRFEGAVLGAFLLALVQALVVWQASGRWSDAATFGVLILFLLFRPTGLLGQRRRAEEQAP